MVEFRCEVRGLAEGVARLRAAAAELPVVTAAATGLAAHAAEAAIKDQLRKSSHARRTPTPSRPGDPPSAISGNLMRSIQVQGPTGAGGTFMSQVGPTAIYSRIQELGGQTGRHGVVTLPPRPFLAPGVEAAREQIAAIFYAAWEGVLHG